MKDGLALTALVALVGLGAWSLFPQLSFGELLMGEGRDSSAYATRGLWVLFMVGALGWIREWCKGDNE